jgi:hypothetical protein
MGSDLVNEKIYVSEFDQQFDTAGQWILKLKKNETEKMRI